MANEYQSLFDQLAAQRAEAQARINEQKAKAQSSFAEQEKLYTQALKGVRTDYSANIAPINQGLESDYQASLASNQQSSLARAAELRAQGVNPASFEAQAQLLAGRNESSRLAQQALSARMGSLFQQQLSDREAGQAGQASNYNAYLNSNIDTMSRELESKYQEALQSLNEQISSSRGGGGGGGGGRSSSSQEDQLSVSDAIRAARMVQKERRVNPKKAGNNKDTRRIAQQVLTGAHTKVKVPILKKNGKPKKVDGKVQYQHISLDKAQDAGLKGPREWKVMGKWMPVLGHLTARGGIGGDPRGAQALIDKYAAQFAKDKVTDGDSGKEVRASKVIKDNWKSSFFDELLREQERYDKEKMERLAARDYLAARGLTTG